MVSVVQKTNGLGERDVGIVLVGVERANIRDGGLGAVSSLDARFHTHVVHGHSHGGVGRYSNPSLLLGCELVGIPS